MTPEFLRILNELHDHGVDFAIRKCETAKLLWIEPPPGAVPDYAAASQLGKCVALAEVEAPGRRM